MSNVNIEWQQKAEIDYFVPFILLWLSFNAWYRSHYCKLADKVKPHRKLLANVQVQG
jgi:hypothetical protein